MVAADRAGAGTNSALDFAPKTTGTTQDAYVRVGNPVKLGLPRFTVEARFIMQNNGRPAFVTVGSYAIPLVTKGRGECDGCPADMNYFLGIQDNVLFADIEIEFTGLRPDEKLYEELSQALEAVVATPHPKIARLVSPERRMNGADFVDRLRSACEASNADPQVSNCCWHAFSRSTRLHTPSSFRRA